MIEFWLFGVGSPQLATVTGLAWISMVLLNWTYINVRKSLLPHEFQVGGTTEYLLFLTLLGCVYFFMGMYSGAFVGLGVAVIKTFLALSAFTRHLRAQQVSESSELNMFWTTKFK